MCAAARGGQGAGGRLSPRRSPSYLLRYGADAGYRPVLIEPDPERAKEAAADGFELADGLDGLPADRTDFVVTDHHRAELGVQLRDALAAALAGSASWATRGTRRRISRR